MALVEGPPPHSCPYCQCPRPFVRPARPLCQHCGTQILVADAVIEPEPGMVFCPACAEDIGL